MAHGRAAVDGDAPVERVAMSGAALAALMQAVNSSAGDCDGVLFGHVERSTTSTMVDEDVGSRTSVDSTAVVTGHFCSGRVTSFYDATGRIDAAKLAQMVGEREARGGDPLVGWFVGRRGTAMRPSMREVTVTTNLRAPHDGRAGILPSSPCIFFLVTESSDAHSIHTHEYRAFQLSRADCFETRAVKIVNIGPAFRGLYHSFSPVAPFPWILKPSTESSDEGLRRLSMDRPQSEKDQALLDMYSQEFSVDRLQSLVRTEGEGGSVRELEALYRTMLRKLDALAKQVCEGNAVIFEQELANSKLKMALQTAGKR